MTMNPARLYAHRLGRAYGPDSSRAALRGSLEGPVDGIETDVCLTADERLVLLHDPLLSLCTNLRGWARERNVAEITRARVLAPDGTVTDERPLQLEELIEMTPSDLTLQLDVKAHADSELARRTSETLCRALERHGPALRDRVEVLSFHTAACGWAAARGLRARLVIFADYSPVALARWATRHRLHGVSVEHFLLSDGLVAPLRSAGLSVNTGTVNEPELLDRVLAARPDAICTDRPHELRAALEGREARTPAFPLAA